MQMKMTCPCCSRQLTAFPRDLRLSELDRAFIDEALGNKFFDDSFSPDNRYNDSRIVEDLETEREAPEVDMTEFMASCICGARFNFRISLRLDKVELPTSLAKLWLSSDVKEELNIRDYNHHSHVSWNQPAPVNTGYHGASVPGCSHNYMFQRNTYNGTIVKCSKCGHEKTM